MWRFFKDFCLYGLVGLLGKIAAIFLLPVYTSVLTKEELGAMALIMTGSEVIGLVSNLNIHSGIARDYYEKGIDKTRLVSTGFLSILTLSLTVLGIMLLSRHFWIADVLSLDLNFEQAFILMLLAVPTASLQSYFAILTRFKKKALLFSVGAFIGLVIRLGIAIVCVVVLRTGIAGIFLGTFLAELFCTVFYALVNKEHIRPAFEKQYLKKALIFSVPTLPAILAGWLDTSVGQIMIGRSISLSDLGVYSIALSISSAFTLVSTALQNVWYPFLYENYSKDGFKEQIRNLFVIFISGLTLISALLSLFSKEVILLLSNETYLAATGYITLLCIPMVLYLIFPFASSGISVSRDTKHIGIAYVAGAVVNLTALFLTIGKFGVTAVPLCLALSRLTSYLYLHFQSGKKMDFSLPNWLIFIFLAVMAGLYAIDRAQLPLAWRTLVAAVTVLPTGAFLILKFRKCRTQW